LPATGGNGFFTTMIEFRNVSYSYPGRQKSPALDDFSLKINEGEDIAVVGGNGSGKTTFGLLLAGILNPQAGEILINGQSISEVKQKPSIGFLFQDPENGLVATTIDREVAFSLENQNIDSSVMKPLVEKQLEVFDLLQYRDRLVWHLSGGEKQRLSLAAIMISKPRILFLDEPASYLDYKGGRY
jgi:energy-coupling factor transporter ATP-binding protein EcfA2